MAQGLVEIAAGADVQLGEHLAQVPLHGAGPDEQLGADLLVGLPDPGQLGDFLLLRSQLGAGVLVPLAYLLAGRQELSPGPFGKRMGPHGRERVVREPQLVAGIDPPVLAAQPFAVAQPGAGQVRRHPGAAQPFERLAVLLFGGAPRGKQRTGPCRRTAGPVAAARRGDLGQSVGRRGGPLSLVAAQGGFYQLIERPGRDDELVGGAGAVGRRGGEPVVAEAVVEHRPGVLLVRQRRALAPGRCPADHHVAQLDRGRRVAAPRGEQERDVRQGGCPDPRVDMFSLR